MTAEPEPTIAPISRPATTRQRYVRWWLDDLPPLDGRLRFVFYTGILLLAQHPDSKSFFLSLEAYRSTDPDVYTARGLLGAIGISYPPATMVQLVITATMGACFLAAIGLFSRFSCVATAAGAFFLHGLFLDTNAGNRAWFVPLYALLALCFTCARDKWSVDHLIRSFFNRQSAPRGACPTVCQTGFARKCLLVTVVGFYFASGLSKLFNAGLAWADGATLHFFSSVYDRPFTFILSENPNLCAALSVGALFLEAGAVLALLSPRLRLLFLISWSLMHIGIRYTMGPWYFSNIWCFILLVDWGAVSRWARDSWIATRLKSVALSSGFKPITELNDQTQTPAEEPPVIAGDQDLPVAAAGRAVGFGTALLALMAAVSLFQIEWWPLTNVDLYSAYFSNETLASYPRSHYRNASRAQEIARETSAKGRPRLAQKFLAYHVELKMIGKDGRVLLLPDGVGVTTQKQWVKSVLMPVIVADLNAKPVGNIAWDAEYPDNPATLFLKRILPVIRRNVPQWQEYDRAVLTYALEGPHPVIASISLHEEEF